MSNRLSIAIDPKLKSNAAKLYENMGMNLSTAVKIFFKQSLAEHRMPFQPHEVNPIDYQTQQRVNNDIDTFIKNKQAERHHLIND